MALLFILLLRFDHGIKGQQFLLDETSEHCAARKMPQKWSLLHRATCKIVSNLFEKLEGIYSLYIF